MILKGDTTAQAAYYRALREIGALNADEIRALEDRGRIPGGSTYYASWNYGPLADFDRLSVIRALGKDPDDEVQHEWNFKGCPCGKTGGQRK